MMPEEDRHIRAVAENLLSSSIQSQRSSYTQRSISSINRDYILSEDFIAGARYNDRMSSVRRFFCLLVTFDLLFTCLMWLICTTIAGENITTAFVQQVLHYRIKSSLFDIIMAAACRFTILLLFYALLHISHWWIVAITTASTCAFLGAKVYFFNWNGVTQPGFQALLILTSFVLAWGEAWFFDCRVVPQETQARNWIINSINSERAPLLRPAFEAPSRPAESMGNFFTPMDSPTCSEDEEDKRIFKEQKDTQTEEDFLDRIALVLPPTTQQIDEHKRNAVSLMNEAYDLLTSDDWKTVQTSPEGDVISETVRSCGKVMRIEGIIKASAAELIDSLFQEVESMPLWNKEVTEIKTIQTIDEDTDIMYQSTRSYGGGIVGPRDFITLRHRGQRGNYFMTTGASVNIEVPHRRNYVRAENGIVAWVTERLPIEDDMNANKCRFIWLINTNLKGWIPQRLIDATITTALIDFMKALRSHVKSLPYTSD